MLFTCFSSCPGKWSKCGFFMLIPHLFCGNIHRMGCMYWVQIFETSWKSQEIRVPVEMTGTNSKHKKNTWIRSKSFKENPKNRSTHSSSILSAQACKHQLAQSRLKQVTFTRLTQCCHVLPCAMIAMCPTTRRQPTDPITGLLRSRDGMAIPLEVIIATWVESAYSSAMTTFGKGNRWTNSVFLAMVTFP